MNGVTRERQISGESYKTTVAPFREQVGSFSPRGLVGFALHDLRHLNVDISTHLPKSRLVQLMRGSSLDEILAQADSLPRITPEEIRQMVQPYKKDAISRVTVAAPYMSDYARVLLCSFNYLSVLPNEQPEKEEQFLAKMAEEQLPLFPITHYYGVNLNIDGEPSESMGLKLDGLMFIAFYNLLKNATSHRVRGTSCVVDLTEDGTVKVSNMSRHLLPDLSDLYACAQSGGFGLFISNLYAKLGGSELVSSVDPLEDDERGARYQVTFTLK